MADPTEAQAIVPGYVVRRATEADLEAINEIGEDEDFDQGMENLRLYFGTSPDSWHVLVETGTGHIAAYDSYNRLSNGIYMGHQIVVRKELRGKGLTRMFNSMSYATFPAMGNATKDSIDRYYLDVFGPKLRGLFGLFRRSKLTRTTSNCAKVRQLSSQDFEQLLVFDRSICVGLDRSSFLQNWTLPKDEKQAVTLLAWIDGKVVGYGTVRDYGTYRWLSPVYADTVEIADYLLRELFSTIEDATFAYIFAPAQNSIVATLANQLNLEVTETEFRWYAPKSWDLIGQHLNWDKIYGIQEYWPC